MQIPLVVLVLVVLVPVSGFIAWAGDRIGHQIGKKRHTLLGLRPRHTAMLFTVGSGIGISLVSFALIWLSSEEFRVVLSKGAQLLTVNRSLRERNQRLAGEVVIRTRETQSARATAKDASALRDETLRQSAGARRDLAKAQADLDDAREALSGEQATLGAAQAALTEARDAYAKTSNRLGATTTELRAASRHLSAAQARVKIVQEQVTVAVATQQTALHDLRKAMQDKTKAQGDLKELAVSAGRTLDEQRKDYDRREAEGSAKIAALNRQKDALERDATAKQNERDGLTKEVAALAEKRDRLVSLAANLRLHPITYHVGEEVERASIPSDQSVWKIEDAVKRAFSAAAQKARDRGAGGEERADALRIAASIPAPVPAGGDTTAAASAILPDEKTVEEETVRALARTIRRSPEPVALVLTATANAVVGEPVVIEVRTFPNAVVIPQDTKLGETAITGGQDMTRQDAADAVYEFLRTDVHKALLAAGIVPAATGETPDEGANSVVTLSGAEWLKIMDDIKRTNYRARVVVKAAKPLRAADPVSLRFEVKPLPLTPPAASNFGIPAGGPLH